MAATIAPFEQGDHPMKQRAWGAAALVLHALLAGCGGGADSAEATARPIAQAAAQRDATAAQAFQASDADVERLLDEAEARYPSIFLSHQPTLTAAPFRYRYYADSGLYFGVATQADMGYAVGGVYVLSEMFGPTPLHLGPLSVFLLSGATSTPEQDNGCRNHALFDRPGTRLSVEYEHTGTIAGNSRVDLIVLGPSIHGGRSTVESAIRTTSHLTSENRTIDRVTDTRFFGHQTGVGEITDLGFDSSTLQSTSFAGRRQDLVIEAYTAYPSGWVQREYALAAGQSITQPRLGSTITRVQPVAGGTPQVTTTAISDNDVISFVGRETITIRAGTFETCKFATHAADKPAEVTTKWMVQGAGGFRVKSETAVDGLLQHSMEATSFKLGDGRPLL